MGTVSDLITEITANVDTSPADALTVLDRRHKLMCARGRWHRLQQTLTAGTATDATYSTLEGPSIVEVFWITATVGGYVGDFRPTNYTDRGPIMDGTLGSAAAAACSSRTTRPIRPTRPPTRSG
jgi:hypothetical protein